MAAMTDPDTFRKHLETNFVFDEGSGPVLLRLVDVVDEGIVRGVRQFSLFFHGPADRALPAQTLKFTHDPLGEIDLFITPILGSNHERLVYQACFSVIA
ncbi:MAG: hypothetical protein ABIQ52_15205 [Vicinamibacterales bacterium]